MRSASPTLDPESTHKGIGACENDGQDQDGPKLAAANRVSARVSILRSAVLPTINSTGAGEEHQMSKTAESSEPASELEGLIAELSQSGRLVFVFGDGWCTAHLVGAATPEFGGPADRRWWGGVSNSATTRRARQCT